MLDDIFIAKVSFCARNVITDEIKNVKKTIAFVRFL